MLSEAGVQRSGTPAESKHPYLRQAAAVRCALSCTPAFPQDHNVTRNKTEIFCTLQFLADHAFPAKSLIPLIPILASTLQELANDVHVSQFD